jgi:hypothetical protein
MKMPVSDPTAWYSLKTVSTTDRFSFCFLLKKQ